MISPFSRGLYRFSSNQIAAKTYSKFQEKYSAHLQSFKAKTGATQKESTTIKKSTQKAYTHPYDDMHHRPHYSVMHSLQTYIDLYGAEQVSPHYENFAMARKDSLTFLAFYFTMMFIGSTPDFHFYARAALPAFAFNFSVFYFYMEAKKTVGLPILNRFYRKISVMEMNNLETYYAENIEARIRNLMSTARNQIEFKSLHNEYLSVRNNTLLSFLINEQVALKNHLYERAQNILKQAESFQINNHAKIINGVMAETLGAVDKAYNENKEQIEKQIFELALQGIAAGQMDYAKDPILPYVVKTIQKTVQKFDSISPAEQKKLVTLTQDQLAQIRASDARLRDEFLQNEPKIDGALKNDETVAKILARWGK